MKLHSVLLFVLIGSLFSVRGAFVPLDNFNALTNGPINGRNGWVSASTVPQVVDDPAGPPNKVLTVPSTAASTSTYKPLGALTISNGTTGTLFLRMRRGGATLDMSIGLSDTTTPTVAFGDFEPQITCAATGTNNLAARDAAVADTVDTFISNQWYRVWMVANNTRDLYSVYLQGGQYATQTLLDGNTDGETQFTFRNTTGDAFNTNTTQVASNLIHFLMRNNVSHVGPVYVDDIYVDNTGANLGDPTVDTTGPAVLGLIPAAGSSLYALTNLTVTFTEPVANVAAASLLINGVAASEMTGFGSNYVFSFPSPTPGPVSVTWIGTHGIIDFAGNAFPGTNVWNYTILPPDVTGPTITAIQPAPTSTINDWAQLQIGVTFSEAVLGVNASDLLVNGFPALALTNLGNIYYFTATQPAPGPVTVAFAPGHGITDLFSNAFDATAPDDSWTYTFTDTVAPFTATLSPSAERQVAKLTATEIVFSEAVSGVDATDLLVNGSPAATASGSGAGPYRFEFAEPPAGPIIFAWTSGHGIVDASANPLVTVAWTNYQALVHSGFALVEDFSALTNGPLNGQNRWIASNACVVAVDPAESQNKVLSVADNITGDAMKLLEGMSISNNTGTVFWRFRRADTQINISQGVSDLTAFSAGARNFGDYEAQLNSNGTNPATLNARDAGSFRQVANFTPDVWFSVWMVIDNASDLYSVYLQGGNFPTQTLLTTTTNASEFLYTFRNTTADTLNTNSSPIANDLVSFMIRASGNSNHVGPFMMDDLYVDFMAVNLGNPLPPAKPAGLIAAPGANQVTLTWNDVPGTTNFVIKRALTSGGPYTAIATNASPSYTDINPGGIYYYVVSALGTNGESFNSTEAGLTQLQIVSVTRAEVDGHGEFTFASISGFTYGIQRAETITGPWSDIGRATATGSTTTFTDTASLTGQVFYRVIYPAPAIHPAAIETNTRR